MANRTGHRGFGSVRRLPSGRWQASYTGPDGARHPGAATFTAKMDAEGWLASERRLIEAGSWVAPAARAAAARRARVEFEEYAERWVGERNLKPRTVEGYQHLLAKYLLPTFGEVAVEKITPADVRTWWARLDRSHPVVNQRAYVLLKGICATAVDDEILAANPCRIRMTATDATSAKEVRPASQEELAAIVAAMPPGRRLLVVLGAWCALRRGELLELRRGDVDLAAGALRVSRAVQWIDNEVIVGTPKSAAGRRTVSIPPHVVPMVEQHLAEFVGAGPDALLFTGADGVSHLTPTALQGSWANARTAAGRPDLRLHDLRHTGATMAAVAGATLAELQARLGHSSVNAALRYQHAVIGRDAEIAAALSAMAGHPVAGDAETPADGSRRAR